MQLVWRIGLIVMVRPSDRCKLLSWRFGFSCADEPTLHPNLSGIRGHGNVGAGCGLHDAYIDARGGVFIGDRTFFGNGVMILSAGHSSTPSIRREVLLAPVTIGSDVWIGSRALVLPGVTIGDGSVIGAGAVVTRDVPGSVLAAGVPARVIRDVDGWGGDVSGCS